MVVMPLSRSSSINLGRCLHSFQADRHALAIFLINRTNLADGSISAVGLTASHTQFGVSVLDFPARQSSISISRALIADLRWAVVQLPASGFICPEIGSSFNCVWIHGSSVA